MSQSMDEKLEEPHPDDPKITKNVHESNNTYNNNDINDKNNENNNDLYDVVKDVTVKFDTGDKGETQIAQKYKSNERIIQIKFDIAKKFDIEPDFVVLKQGDDYINDDYELHEILNNDYGIIELKLCLNSEGIQNCAKLDIQQYYKNCKITDMLAVAVPDSCDVIVEIENQAIPKPFMGGYINVCTDLEYHDTFTQTGPPASRIKFSGISSRDTQTAEEREKAENCHYDRCTQAFGASTRLSYIPEIGDRVLTPRPYVTHEAIEVRRRLLEKVCLIQRNFRAYLIRKLIKKCAAEWRQIVEERLRRKEEQEEEYLNRCKEEVIVKTFPKTRQDFDMLYDQVQKWKTKELERINRHYSGGPKVAEINCLLDKEIQLLNKIERQRLELREYLKEIRQAKMLCALGKPVEWVGYKNCTVSMDTLRNQRNRFLTKYFFKLKQPLSSSDRIELLNECIGIIEKEEHSQTKELIELFERELYMLFNKTKDDDLEPLRVRQSVALMDIIKDEEHFPTKKIPTRICEKCRIVRPVREFVVHSRLKSFNICRSCDTLKPPPVDKSVYRAILRSIRRDERKRGAFASYAFLIQEDDIRHIIENIWFGHSVISQCAHRADLRLPRWNIALDWSPWNCLCVTEAEARSHIKILHLELVYEERLLKDITSKHEICRSTFKNLLEKDDIFVESGQWHGIGEDFEKKDVCQEKKLCTERNAS